MLRIVLLACVAALALPAAAQVPCAIRGDLNCDEVVDCDDITPFATALTDPNAYVLQYPNCPIMNADINQDGYITFADINPFLELLDEAPIKGDMNCDKCVNSLDVDPFVLALSNPCLWKQTYPGCSILNGDCNGDGLVTFADINCFVDLLNGNAMIGDMDCDKCITAVDVDEFVAALTDPETWQEEHPGCPILNGDCDGDGLLTFADINCLTPIYDPGCD